MTIAHSGSTLLNLTTSYVPLKPSPTIHKIRRIKNEERERDDCRIDNFVHCLERLQLPVPSGADQYRTYVGLCAAEIMK